MAAGVVGSTICSPSFFLTSYLRTTEEAISSFYPTPSTTLIGQILAIFLIGAACYAAYVLIEESKKSSDNNDEERAVNNSTKLVESESDHDKNSAIDELRKFPAAIVSAAIFSFGLNLGGMTETYRIIGFLDLKGFFYGTWDPTLAFVMGGGLLVSAFGYEFIPGYSLVMVSVCRYGCIIVVQKRANTICLSTGRKMSTSATLYLKAKRPSSFSQLMQSSIKTLLLGKFFSDLDGE